METIDWRFILFISTTVQTIFGIVIFCVLKFNDIAHIDADLKEVKIKQTQLMDEQNKRHIENITAINNLSVKVSEIYGRFMAVNKSDK